MNESAAKIVEKSDQNDDDRKIADDFDEIIRIADGADDEISATPPKLTPGGGSLHFSPYKSHSADVAAGDLPPKIDNFAAAVVETPSEEIYISSDDDDKPEMKKTPAENAEKFSEKIADRFLNLKKKFGTFAGDCFLIDVFRNVLENVDERKPSAEFFREPSAFYVPPSRIVDMIVEYPSRKSWGDFRRELQMSHETDFDGEKTDLRRLSSRTLCPNFTRQLLNVGLENVQSFARNSSSKLIFIKRDENQSKNEEISDKNVVWTKANNKSRKRKRRTSSDSSSTPSCSTSDDDDESSSAAVGPFDVQFVDGDEKTPSAENVDVVSNAYKCPVRGCRFLADTLIGLENHREAPHKERLSREYLCAMCDQSSATTIYQSRRLSDVERHARQNHRLCLTYVRHKNYDDGTCTFCQRTIYRSLESHVTKCEKKFLAWFEKKTNFTTMPPFIGTCTFQDQDILNRYLWPPKPSLPPTKFTPKPAPAFFRKERDYLLENFKLKPVVDKPNFVAPKPYPPMKVRQSVHDVVDSIVGSKIVVANAARLPAFILRPAAPTTQRFSSPATSAAAAKILRIYSEKARQASAFAVAATVEVPFASTATSVSGATTLGGRQIGQCQAFECELCDANLNMKENYIVHLRSNHNLLNDRSFISLIENSPFLSCSRCSRRFFSNDGLQRHLLMDHLLVDSDMLSKAGRKQDGGKCKHCRKIFGFNILQHLINVHKFKLQAAEILYTCDLCQHCLLSYAALQSHLKNVHEKKVVAATTVASKARKSVSSLKNPFIAEKSSPKLQKCEKNEEKLSRDQQCKVSTRKTFCCNPCQLKFNIYADVLEHWARRHLKRLKIPLCRIDQCKKCSLAIKCTCDFATSDRKRLEIAILDGKREKFIEEVILD